MASSPKNYTTSNPPVGTGKVITGARAVVRVNGNIVGIFESCSVAKNFGTEPIFILGSYIPREIAITSSEVVTVTCAGFRVVGTGLNTLPAVPLVSDLLTFDALTITVVDRQSGQTLETIQNCVPTSDNTNYNAKASSRVNVTYTGTIGWNEDQTADNDSGSTDLP